MDIPMEMLIDYMGYLNPEVRLRERDMTISGIKLMPEDGRLDLNYLYFSQYADEIITGSAPVVLVCPKGTRPAPGHTNCIILHTDVPVTAVFNELLGLQTLIRNWGQDVELSISRHEGVQRLLDLSGRVFGNPIAIITPAFKTIAATWEYETDDVMFWELLELGYLTRDTFNKLQAADYFSPKYYTGKTVIIERDDLHYYPSAMTSISQDDAVGFIVLMLCSNTSMSRGLMQLYNYFVDKLRFYLQPAASQNDYIKSQFDYFIIDIIEGRVSSPREILERSFVYPPTYSAEYNTILISHDSSSPMYLEHAQQNISAVFPNMRQILYGTNIILHSDLGTSAARRSNFLAKLETYLESARAWAGVSETMLGLETVRESHRQAQAAITLGRKLSFTLPPDEMLGAERSGSRIYHFKDYQIYSMLTGSETGGGQLDIIRRHDLDHNTNYFKILFVLLSTERNFTKSAAILGMHRNNVIYHAKRISELFDLDLEAPSQRLRIQLLYRLEELQSAPSI